MDLNDYFYFVNVVEKGGFTAAGRALGVPKSRLSRHVQQLEERLGVRLIQRTSRRFLVTEIGETFFRHARAALDDVNAAEAAIKRETNTLTGRVRISCSVGMAQFALSEALTTFLIDHPGVDVVQHVTNRSVDLIESGLDIAIRGHSGPLPDSSMIQRRIAPTPWYLHAAPAYLDRMGTPTTPETLQGHVGLKVGWRPEVGQWSLRDPDGLTATIPYQPRLCSDDMFTLKAAATRGMGLVALPGYVCRDDVVAGRLVRVLPEWTAGSAQLSLLMPARGGVMPAVEALAGFLMTEIPRVVADPQTSPAGAPQS